MNKVVGIILLVDNIENSVSFYKKLGFVVKKEVPDIATTVSLGEFWVELLHQGKVVSDEYKEAVHSPNKGSGAYLQVQVDDIDAFYREVITNGVSSPHKPMDYPWGHREFIVQDPDGYKIAFFSLISSVPSVA